MQRLISVATILPLAGMARVADQRVGDIAIHQPTARQLSNGANVRAAFMPIENNGASANRRSAATAENADHVEIHQMSVTKSAASRSPLRSAKPRRSSRAGFHEGSRATAPCNAAPAFVQRLQRSSASAAKACGARPRGSFRPDPYPDWRLDCRTWRRTASGWSWRGAEGGPVANTVGAPSSSGGTPRSGSRRPAWSAGVAIASSARTFNARRSRAHLMVDGPCRAEDGSPRNWRSTCLSDRSQSVPKTADGSLSRSLRRTASGVSVSRLRSPHSLRFPPLYASRRRAGSIRARSSAVCSRWLLDKPPQCFPAPAGATLFPP